MRRRVMKFSRIKLSSAVLFILGGLGLLGSLGLTPTGIKIYSLFSEYMGAAAWVVPFILLILSMVGWLSTSQPLVKVNLHPRAKGNYRNKEQRTKDLFSQSNAGSTGIQLPPGKLISLKGFNDYFSSPELNIEASAAREDLSEIGTDFNSYFKKGESAYTLPQQMVPVNGFEEYFESYEQTKQNTHIDAEKSEANIFPAEIMTNDNELVNDSNSDKVYQSQDTTYYPGQVAQLVQRGTHIAKSAPWSLPPLNLLDPTPGELHVEENSGNPEILEEVLNNFGIKGKVVKVTHGPVITRYELVPAPGIKISRIVSLADDIALALAARDVRIEAPIPGKSAIGIEVPKQECKIVSFREVIESSNYKEHKSLLKIALGKDIAGSAVVADLGKMPHLMVAGATGSGKSVCINTIINSILYNATPQEVKLLLIDPKMVELSSFNGIPHLLAPVVTDPRAAASFLKWAVKEMESRYELFAARGVRDLKAFNASTKTKIDQEEASLPLIVIIIDELADLMMVSANDVEEAICRLAQMARAAGIHLIIATQRPSVDVITGVIKANIPSRIAFAVTSQIDSRTILDSTGAEKLLGKGDMLFSPIGLNKAIRVQGCFINDEEARRVTEHWKDLGSPDYLTPETILETKNTDTETTTLDDELFMEAAELVIASGMASVSYLQRKFKIGYSRAARLIDLLEEEGVVGGYEGPKPRQVLMDMEQFSRLHS